jgi:hypothetical protein
VDLTTRPAILLRWPATTLDYYELLRSARPLHGAVRLPPPSEVRIDDIPAGEITRLLRKRGAGLLLAWVRFMAADEALSTSIAESVQLDVDKAFLACGDTWLYRHGEYDHRLLVRVERFRRLRSIGLGPTARLHEEYERSAHQRLLPSGPEPPAGGASRAVAQCGGGMAPLLRESRNGAGIPVTVRRRYWPGGIRYGQ